MFKNLLISLELSDSDIDTAVQNWSTVEDNTLVNNAAVESVIDVIDKAAEQEEEDKVEAQEVEMKLLQGNITIDISAYECTVEVIAKNIK